MEVLTGVVIALLAVAVGLRVHSRLRPTPFPPWLTPILEAPWRDREQMVARCGIAPGERVLEVGPGAGWVTETALRVLGPAGRLVCLDIQKAMLEKVRTRLGERAPWLVCASGSELPFRAGAFDRAFLLHVLGEIPDKSGAVRELARVIRGGGELAVGEALPDPDYIRPKVLSRLLHPEGFEPKNRLGGSLDYVQRFVRP